MLESVTVLGMMQNAAHEMKGVWGLAFRVKGLGARTSEVDHRITGYVSNLSRVMGHTPHPICVLKVFCKVLTIWPS